MATFGKEDTGDHTDDFAGFIVVAPYTSGAAGTAVTLHAASKEGNTYRLVIYDASFGLVDYTAEHVHTGSDGTFNSVAVTLGATIEAATVYYMGLWFSGTGYLYYTDNGKPASYFDVYTYHSTNPPVDPLDTTGWGNRAISVFCTYSTVTYQPRPSGMASGTTQIY